MKSAVIELVRRDLLHVASNAVGETAMIDAQKLIDVAGLLVDMQSRLESLEKDAARYRMIRDHQQELDTKEHCIFDRDGWEIHGLLQGDALDAAIDAAMKG